VTALAIAPSDVIEMEVETDPGDVLTYNLKNLCSVLDINDPTRVAVDTDGLRRALITIYPSNPLAVVRAATREDLKMDRWGRITIGYHHNGKPCKKRLYDPTTGSAQRFLLFGTTGAGKSRALQLDLIAEKVNRICSALVDLKNGQSVPEARRQVALYGDTQEMAILILFAAVNVANARMARYSRMGRNAFVLGEDPLFHVTLDEVNRLLEKGAPYRALATRLIKEIGRTGRSVGVGIRLAAQASHLEELGGSDTLRAMMKEGEVVLLRWSSSIMKQLVSDGLLPTGEQLMPIPKSLVKKVLRSQFDATWEDDLEEGAPGTQGMAYHLSSENPTSQMRHLRVGSIAPTPGLDPEILALYGDEPPTELAEADWEAAGDVWKYRHDPDMLRGLCDAFREEFLLAQQGKGGGASVDGEMDDDAPAPVKPATISDRIMAAVNAAEGPVGAEEIWALVNADGNGKQVQPGSIKNKLGPLADKGLIARVGHGLYAPNH
jgi:hypothetical protein